MKISHLIIKNAKIKFTSFTYNMNSINFKARFIDNIEVKKLDSNGEFKPHTVSFAKMNPYSQADCKSVEDINKLWGGDTFVNTMLRHSQRTYEDKLRDVYFLTEQKDNFRKIIPEKVLGMIEVTKDEKFHFINFIQARPDLEYTVEGRHICDVGKRMLNMVEKLAKGKKLVLNSLREKIPFYIKYGFRVTYDKCPYPKMVLDRAKLIK